MKSKFSIITVTFNAEKQLEKTMLSVLNQTVQNIEYIIIDGGSKDGTLDVIKKHEARLSYWISEPDNGLYDAMNKGLMAATGDYVWFLNAGDELKHNEIVEELSLVVSQNELPDILYGETDLIHNDGIVFARRRLKAPAKLTWKSFRMGMLVCHQAFIAKRIIAPDYDLHYRFSADFDWCIRCMKSSKRIINTQLRLINYQYDGLTTANRNASLKERYAIMCKYYGIFVTAIVHLWFAIRFYWAKWIKKII